MNVFNLLPALMFLGISIWCFYLGIKGIKTGELIFKKGTKGTSLPHSKWMIKAQIIVVFVLGICLLCYALLHILVVLKMINVRD